MFDEVGRCLYHQNRNNNKEAVFLQDFGSFYWQNGETIYTIYILLLLKKSASVFIGAGFDDALFTRKYSHLFVLLIASGRQHEHQLVMLRSFVATQLHMSVSFRECEQMWVTFNVSTYIEAAP